jgi:hypothetical protein
MWGDGWKRRQHGDSLGRDCLEDFSGELDVFLDVGNAGVNA